MTLPFPTSHLLHNDKRFEIKATSHYVIEELSIDMYIKVESHDKRLSGDPPGGRGGRSRLRQLRPALEPVSEVTVVSAVIPCLDEEAAIGQVVTAVLGLSATATLAYAVWRLFADRLPRAWVTVAAVVLVAAAYGVVALVLQGGWAGRLVGIDTASRYRELYSVATPDAIRNWALGVGDDNPLYTDPPYASASSWGSPIAPPLYPFVSGISRAAKRVTARRSARSVRARGRGASRRLPSFPRRRVLRP